MRRKCRGLIDLDKIAVHCNNRLGGELSWFCQVAAPKVWWLLLGTADTSPRHSSELGVVTNDWPITTKEIMCTSHL